MTDFAHDITPVDDPRFNEFLRGLLYSHLRQEVGVPLDDFQARDLLADELALMAYYQQWTPDHWPVPQRRRPAYTAAQQARAIFAAIGAACIAVIVIAAGVVAALLTYGMLVDGIDVPVIGG